MSENDVQRVPFGMPLGGFWVVWGGIWEDEKIVPKIMWPKVTRKFRELPAIPGIDPCVPLKEQSQDWKDWKTGPMIRNTTLVPCRHGGGFVYYLATT